jgi:4-amino-4-deoxy-L-arabinose transferase-like glycosyltransferase
MEKKKLIIYLLLIFLLSFIIRVGFIVTLDTSVDVWGDWWSELGLRLAGGEGFWVANPFFDGPRFYSWRLPGFPFFLAAIYRIFGHSFFAAKIGLAFLSSLSVILTFFIGKNLINERGGFIAALTFVFYPPAIFWTGFLAPETLSTTIILTLFLALILGEKTKKIYLFFISGIFLGVGILTRSVFLVILPTIILWLLIKNKKLLLTGSLSILAGCLLLVTPWIIRNYRIHRTFVLTSTEGGLVSYIGNNPMTRLHPAGFWHPPLEYYLYHVPGFKNLSEVQINRLLYQRSLSFIRAYPKEFFLRVANRFLRCWRLFPHTISGPGEPYTNFHVWVSLSTLTPLFLCALYGIVLSFKKWKSFLLAYFFIFAWTFPVILFFRVAIRYREPIMPFMIIFFSLAIEQLLAKKTKAKDSR